MNDHHGLSIVPYNTHYKSDFKRLNEAWITEYFEMEELDHQILDHPEHHILNSGGEIWFAEVEQTIAGTCALIRSGKYLKDFELAKLAVDPLFRGQGIGYQLGMTIVHRAKSLGAQSIHLESNKLLVPAIKLYQKLGFTEVNRPQSPFARANIQMELKLTALAATTNRYRT